MVTKFPSKTVLIFAICFLMSSTQSLTMQGLSPAVRQRVGIGLLAIATNLACCTSMEAVSQQTDSDAKEACMWGLTATWFTTNIHLLRSLVSPKGVKAAAHREAALGAATFATGFLGTYLDAKLHRSPHESAGWSIIRQGLRGSTWTTSALATLAIFYETVFGK